MGGRRLAGVAASTRSHCLYLQPSPLHMTAITIVGGRPLPLLTAATAFTSGRLPPVRPSSVSRRTTAAYAQVLHARGRRSAAVLP
ncbi:hypothetical protein B296_00015648 [Ensete ventricosum]|uniref:Uncharacterized protein n=1 Tax=Ensete ventricosum TaxID=4639 RepID=A0A426YVJ5_ENSVE|nr:hypothetical protein B296_00015648 [Ensete ventricosum]